MSWTVYILQCADETLYTGITNDLERRIAAHRSGQGARYTKGRGPLDLVYQEHCDDRGQALKRENQIKSLDRKAKLQLVAAR
ncbi:MAG: GIY-YIG nuclease family protein [Chloroflexi bacterium]|nr:GIY-YIG nuclease family protein [Chloroflexota bacterium]MDA1271092.1 GIY-YIG nuclease family protein [Chloroflexota bacterium]PKB58579.1 MAG: endonuclease [SAR202 cluster bacterium Casp-Chloro-G2]